MQRGSGTPPSPPEFHRQWGSVNSDVGFFYPGTQPPCDLQHTLAYQIHCDRGLLNAKFAALQAHTTQTTVLINQLGPQIYRQWWSTESFIDAALKAAPGEQAQTSSPSPLGRAFAA